MGAMDSSRWLRASGHLDRVLELPPQAREACLAALREEDPDSAADVAALLDEHRRLTAEGFLDSAPPMPREAPLAGVTIGAYTLVSRIGHGGMGTVWLAARSDGRFQGQAALKLLNAALVGRGGEERWSRPWRSAAARLDRSTCASRKASTISACSSASWATWPRPSRCSSKAWR